jgi:CubicO group peptidase (beta-lactamase class C family)
MASLCKISLVILSFLALSCSKENNPVDSTQGDYKYTVPTQTSDGWVTTSLTDVGMLEQPIVDMVNFIENSSNHQIHNILIIKDKKLVFEKYFSALDYSISPPALGSTFISYNMDMLHYLASGSKSVTSVLFGIAIDKGFINNDVNKNIITYFPQYSSILTGEKENITVKHLLTMSSGLDWDESTYPFGDSRNDVTQLFQQSDPVRFVLAKNLLTQPGTMFYYNSGVTNVLADIIRMKSGLNLIEFAKKYLFQPLNITKYSWQKMRGEYYFASGGLSLRPRDMAKIGYLFLNQGQWDGQQIINPEWLEASKQNYINPNLGFADGYGYQWWLKTVQSGENEIKYLFAAGYGEQLMFVVPALDLMVIFNCGYFDVPISVSPYQLIDDYIVPALFNEL